MSTSPLASVGVTSSGQSGGIIDLNGFPCGIDTYHTIRRPNPERIPVPEPTLKDLLSVAMDAAYLAGRRTLAYFNAEVAVETKADDTPVTRADREAEQVIRERIGRYFPDHCVLGEEAGERRGPDERYRWIIDPIDGTKSFIHGVPMYGVLIGVEVRGEAGVGAVYLPGTDEPVSAARGFGATHNGRPARVSSVSQLSQACLLTSSFQGSLERWDAY